MTIRTSNPTPAEVRAAREAAGLSQEAAADKVHCTRIAWARWESEGADARRMHPGIWDSFRLLTGQHPEFVLVKRPSISI